MVSAIAGRAAEMFAGSGSLGSSFLFPQAASCMRGVWRDSIVGQGWEGDRQNTPASQCHATEEVREKYALR